LGSPCAGRLHFCRPHPQPLLIRVHRLGSLHARRSRFFALTPSPSPTRWERGVGANACSPCRCFPPLPPRGLITRQFLGRAESEADFAPLLKVPPASRGEPGSGSPCWQGEPQGGGRKNCRAMSLAGEGDTGGEGKRARALPQRRKENRVCLRDFVPDGCTLTSSPSPTQWERGVRFPLSRKAREGDTGGEGKKPRLTLCTRWEKSPLPQRFCAEPLYPYQEEPPSPHVRGPGWGIVPKARKVHAACAVCSRRGKPHWVSFSHSMSGLTGLVR
jgi:hypothetical protein